MRRLARKRWAATASKPCPKAKVRTASRIRQTIASEGATTSAQRCGRQGSRLATSRPRNKFRHENRRHPSSYIPIKRRAQWAAAKRKEKFPARCADPCAKGEQEPEPARRRHQYPAAQPEFRRIDRSRERRCASEVQFPSETNFHCATSAHRFWLIWRMLPSFWRPERDLLYFNFSLTRICDCRAVPSKERVCQYANGSKAGILQGSAAKSRHHRLRIRGPA